MMTKDLKRSQGWMRVDTLLAGNAEQIAEMIGTFKEDLPIIVAPMQMDQGGNAGGAAPADPLAVLFGWN
jgi:hypothetical protein